MNSTSPRPKLSLNTSLSPGSNSPKMSDKGFIQPHASHLPRRVRGSQALGQNRATGPQPIQHQKILETNPQEGLQLQQDIIEKHSRINNVEAVPQPTKPQLSTHPHRDNVPRRTRAKTAPINTDETPPTLLSVIDSQSTNGQTSSLVHAPHVKAEEEQQLSPAPPPFKLNPKALSLISKAQNRAFKSAPSQILIDSDLDLDHRPPLSSPQLPHPAMGLTMGIMETYAENEDDGHARRAHAILRSGLSCSPAAMGVKGTPPAVAFPAHTPTFVPVPTSRSIPTKTYPPTPIPVPTPPATAPLGQNLPRRHRYRRRAPEVEAGGVVGETNEKQGNTRETSGQIPEVLRFERNRVEGNEEEDGLFSSHLDFQRAGSEAGWRVETGDGKARKDGRCIQALGKSCVEVGYMREFEVEGLGDCVLLDVVDGEGEADSAGRLRLQLPDNAAVCREGVPSLSLEQLREGCELMKGWLGPACEEGKRRIRVSAPRWRAQDAFGLAVSFLAWVESQWDPEQDKEHHHCIVPLNVNDFHCTEDYTSIHLLYMRLLDEAGYARDVRGTGIELGIVGVGLGPEEGEQAEGDDVRSAHSDSTTVTCRSTLLRLQTQSNSKATERASSSSLSFPSQQDQVDKKSEWIGLREEWRGVLSYEGLNSLIGVWA